MVCMSIVIAHEERNIGCKTIAGGQTQIFHLCDRYLNSMTNWWIYYFDEKNVTSRKAGNYLLARKSKWRRWDTWWSQDIDLGRFDALWGRLLRVWSVECRGSARSGELRFGELGPSEWCTLWWIIRYFLPMFLLATSCAAHPSSWDRLVRCTSLSITTNLKGVPGSKKENKKVKQKHNMRPGSRPSRDGTSLVFAGDTVSLMMSPAHGQQNYDTKG